MSWSERWRLTKEQEALWRADLRLMKEGALEEGEQKGHAEGLAEGEQKGRAEGLAEGRTEGLAEGEQKGEAKKQREIARRMKARGRPVAEIIEDTGLAAEEVERL
jgi:predicted transposase YdaD